MRRGFTLIELLVVIAIIAILAALLLPVPRLQPGVVTGRKECAKLLLSIEQNRPGLQ